MPKRYVVAADAVEHLTREWARDLQMRNRSQGPYELPFIDVVKRPNHWRRVYELEPLMMEDEILTKDERIQ